MISTTTNRVALSGDGTTLSFNFPYPFEYPTDLVVFKYDTLLSVVTGPLTLNTNYSVTGTPNSQGIYTGGGNVVLSTAPLSTDRVVIVRSPAFVQNYNIYQNGTISSQALAQEFDHLTLLAQRLEDQVSRAFTLPDGSAATFSTTFPTGGIAGAPLVVNSAATGLAFGTAASAGSSLPSGGSPTNVLLLNNLSMPAWGAFAYSGFSARFNSAFTSVSLDDTLAQILNLQYAAPTVSLSASGAGTIYEKGSPVTSSTLTATIGKRSNTIAAVRFYQGASLINTVATPPLNGGTSTYGWTGSITDNTTFSTQVDDNTSTSGGPTTVSASASFTFVYPYYVGAGTTSLSGAQIAALTKRVITSTASRTETITATAGQVFYFAYPASYGALTSILDVNGFQTISDWTQSTVSITGLDGTSQSYYAYKFNNPVAAGSYQYTFTR